MKILIAEDDRVSQMILQRSLERLGYQCLVTPNGEEALAAFQREQPDVIISDWMMPGLDGPELCRRVRAASNGTYTYFILLTALTDRSYFLEGMAAGADDFLTKPLDRDELRVRLKVAERVTSLHRELAAKNAELERLNQALFITSRRDALTGLANRLQLREDLDRLAEERRQQPLPISVALCDIDYFKRFNDSQGHMAGDQALRAVASVLVGHGRQGDGAYRYGGEEFLLVYPGRTLNEACIAVERLRIAVMELRIPHPENPNGGVVTISAGVATLAPEAPPHWARLFEQADEALYQAKAQGRNRVMVATARSA